MLQLHLYFAATFCVLVQLTSCEQRCSNVPHRPLSFSVVNKRNATCHWMPEVLMDEGADDPLLNGGWHVRVSLPKVSTQGYGRQVIEVMATKRFNEITASTNIPCGATSVSSIMSLIDATQNTIDGKDRATTSTTIAGAIALSVDASKVEDVIHTLSTEATTSKKIDILFIPTTKTSQPILTSLASTTPRTIITSATSPASTTPTATLPTTEAMTTVNKISTNKSTIISEASSISTPTTETTPASTTPTPTATTTKTSTTLTTAISNITVVPTTKKSDILLIHPFTSSQNYISNEASTSEIPSDTRTSEPAIITIKKATASITEVPTTKKSDIFTAPPKVSVFTESSISAQAVSQTGALTISTQMTTNKSTFISEASSIFTPSTQTTPASTTPTPTATTTKTSTTLTTAKSNITVVPTTKKSDILLIHPYTSSQKYIPTEASTSEIPSDTRTSEPAIITITKATASITEVPATKKSDIFTPPPRVSVFTESSTSAQAVSQTGALTINPKMTTKPKTSTPNKLGTLSTVTEVLSPTSPANTVYTAEASTPAEKVSPTEKEGTGSSGGTGKPTTAPSDLDDNDKIDDSDLGENVDDLDETLDPDIDIRTGGANDDKDKEEDYIVDYSLDLNVEVE